MNQEFQQQKVLPNATAVLVLGILSIVFSCCCYGLFGAIMGIIALVMAHTSTKMYNETPHAYNLSSYKNMNAGRVCAIIGVVLSGLMLLAMLISFLNDFNLHHLDFDPFEMDWDL